jgi:hypothetical protein
MERVVEIDGKIERSERADLIQQVLAEVQPRLRKNEPTRILIDFMGNSIDIGPLVSGVSSMAKLYGGAVSRLISR